MRWLLAAILVALPLPASAHPLDVGALRLAEEEGGLALDLDVSLPFYRKLAANRGLAAPGETLGPGEPPALLAATLASGPLTIAGIECPLSALELARGGERLRLRAHAACRTLAGLLRWELPFVAQGSLTFQLLVHAERGGSVEERVLEPGSQLLELGGESHSSFWDFVIMGIRHIGATPGEWWGRGKLKLPEGLDHILFLVALLLLDVQLLSVLKTVTGFTVGHSITLSLAALGLVQLPPRVIESVIALTIAVVAGEDLWVVLRREAAERPGQASGERPETRRRPRWQLAMGFGLVHGFGFARALADLHLGRGRLLLALVGFNLGVEVGQAVIVMVVGPLLWLAYRSPALRRLATPAIAASILAAALVWFVQRAFY